MERPVLTYTVILAAIVALAWLRARAERTDDRRRENGLPPAWEPLFRALGSIEIGILALLLGSLVFFGCLQIVLRNFFERGIVWADPLMRHVVLWLGCLGGVLATARIRHISIDVLTRAVPARFAGIRDKVIYLATALASSVLGFAALRLVLVEKDAGEEAFLGISVWILQSILPAAFFLIAYRSVVNMLLGRKGRPVDWEDVEPLKDDL